MSPLEIILLANIVGGGALVLWQRHRINAIEARIADKTHLRLLAEVFKLRAQRVETRQCETEQALTAFVDAFPARMKGYVPRESFAKSENTFDERVKAIILREGVTPLDQQQRVCSRCNRTVARYELFPDQTVICANCNYKPEFR